MDQDEIIQRFITKYNEFQEGHYEISRWPDKEDRNTRACDAYAEANRQNPLAIEHTNVETFSQQLLDAKRFMKVIGTLETALKNSFTCQTNLIVPTFAIQPGTNWQAINTALREWLLKSVPDLHQGRSTHEIDEVPFPITIDIDRDERMRPVFLVSRWVPPGVDNYHQLTEGMAAALNDKSDQLRTHHEQGVETVLILESQDIALVSHVTLYKAFLKALNRGSTNNIDQVWVAETYQDSCHFVCFQADEAIMNKANPDNFELGPRYADDWAEAIRQDEIKHK
jgi:hypothetical protein